MNTSPIVLFVYNRPWHTRKTVEALIKNNLAKESELIIYSDAAKNSKAEKNVMEVRRFIHTVTGFKTIQIIERSKNWGLANSIIDGVSSVVNKYGKIIVLEDDLVTSPYFLNFMNEALNQYENNNEVISIHGYVYPIDNLPDTFFLKGADCWGWATWKENWALFESDGLKLLDNLTKKNLQQEFDFNNSYNFTKMLKQQIQGKNDSWAIRWYASAFLQNKLTLYPGSSYIKNIGNDNSGTHCKETHKFDTNLTNEGFLINKSEVKQNLYARSKFEDFFRSIEPSSFMGQLKQKVRGYI